MGDVNLAIKTWAPINKVFGEVWRSNKVVVIMQWSCNQGGCKEGSMTTCFKLILAMTKGWFIYGC